MILRICDHEMFMTGQLQASGQFRECRTYLFYQSSHDKKKALHRMCLHTVQSLFQ